MSKKEQLFQESIEVKVKLDAAIEMLPSVTFKYEKGITRMGPDSFDCYLGCTLNEHINRLTNQYNFLMSIAEGQDKMIDIDEL
jgi:hypothetical protein